MGNDLSCLLLGETTGIGESTAKAGRKSI